MLTPAFSAIAFLGIPVAIGFRIAGEFVPGVTTAVIAVALTPMPTPTGLVAMLWTKFRRGDRRATLPRLGRLRRPDPLATVEVVAQVFDPVAAAPDPAVMFAVPGVLPEVDDVEPGRPGGDPASDAPWVLPVEDVLLLLTPLLEERHAVRERGDPGGSFGERRRLRSR